MIVNWTDFAKERLHKIHQYIAEDSPAIADKTIERVVNRSIQIRDFQSLVEKYLNITCQMLGKF